MISARMSRALKVLLLLFAAAAMVVATAACGSEKIALSRSNPSYAGAVLFNQRCSGCHTLSYAATHGSAANVRSSQYNNGPNFDVRCERPITRVLYAIENGGFSGAIMPQNIVVGQQAAEVARFVATYAGSRAPKVPGVATCRQKPVGSIPALTAAATTSTSPPAPTATTGGAAPSVQTPTPARKRATKRGKRRPAKKP